MKHLLAILFLLMPLAAMADVNVSTYGAVGNLLYLQGITTISNSGAITALQSAIYTNGPYSTTAFVSGDVGKTLEVFGAGTYRGATNEDLTGIITAVTDGTHCTIDHVSGWSGGGQTGLYATNCQAAISNAIVLGCIWPGVTNLVLNSGNYFCADPAFIAGIYPGNGGDTINCAYGCFLPKRGGITFTGGGADKTNTTLTFNQAWKQLNGICQRGTAFQLIGGMTNRLALGFTNLTIAGGWPLGFSGNHGGGNGPASPISGFGCDETASFLVEFNSGGGDIATNIVLNNVISQGCAGEMYKKSSGGNTFVYQLFTANNCVFQDGNLTAINNLPFALTSCTFPKMIECLESDLSGCLSNSFMANCTLSFDGHGAAILGALIGVTYPSVTFSSVFFNCSTYGILLGSAQNITLSNCQFAPYPGDSLTAVTSQFAGSQGTDVNSNLVMNGVSFTNTSTLNIARDVYGTFILANSTGTVTSSHFPFVTGSSLYTLGNLQMFSNNVSPMYLDGSTITTGFYPLDQTNNTIGVNPFDSATTIGVNQTNVLAYSIGRFHNTITATASSALYCQENPLNPSGAILKYQNNSAVSIPVYLSSSLTGNPVIVANGTTQIFYWFSPNWGTNSFPPVVIIPQYMFRM